MASPSGAPREAAGSLSRGMRFDRLQRKAPQAIGSALTEYATPNAVHYLMGAIQQGRWVRRWYPRQPFYVFAVDGLPASWSRMLASHCIPVLPLGKPLLSTAVAQSRWVTALSKLLVFNQLQFKRIVLLDGDMTFWTQPSPSRSTAFPNNIWARFMGQRSTQSFESIFDLCPAPKFCASRGRAHKGFYRGPLRLVNDSTSRSFNSGVMVFTPSARRFAWLMANLQNKTGLLRTSHFGAADQTFLWRFLDQGSDSAPWWELPWTFNFGCGGAATQKKDICFPLVNPQDPRLAAGIGWALLHGKPWTRASPALNSYTRVLWEETRAAGPPCPQRGFNHSGWVDEYLARNTPLHL